MDAAVSFILGITCGMGVGSAGLFVSYLVITKGTAQRPAQGANLLFFLAAGLAAMSIHLRRREIPADRFLRIALPAAASAAVGAALGGLIPATVLRPAFGVLLIAAGTTSGIRAVAGLRKK